MTILPKYANTPVDPMYEHFIKRTSPVIGYSEKGDVDYTVKFTVDKLEKTFLIAPNPITRDWLDKAKSFISTKVGKHSI